MNVYKPRRIVGGNIGRHLYKNVIKAAKGIVHSKLAKDLGNETKQQILEVGSKAINKMLTGSEPVKTTIKDSVSTLRSKLPLSIKRRFKHSVLGRKKFSRKVGGLTLYRLRKQLAANRRKSAILYRLSAKNRALYKRRRPVSQTTRGKPVRGRKLAKRKKKKKKKKKKNRKVKSRRKTRKTRKTRKKRKKRKNHKNHKTRKTRNRKPVRSRSSKRLRTVFDL